MSSAEFVEEKVPNDVFENAIRRYGVVAACEWFGHSSDSRFTSESINHLSMRMRAKSVDRMSSLTIPEMMEIVDSVDAPTRPTDRAILGALALHFKVPTSTAFQWLVALDMKALQKVLIEEVSIGEKS